MSHIYDWTKPGAKVEPLRSLEAGSLVVMHKSIPDKNDEYHILEITGDDEHEFNFIGSMQKSEIALLVADFLLNYFKKIRKQKIDDRDPYDFEVPGLDAMLNKIRPKTGPRFLISQNRRNV